MGLTKLEGIYNKDCIEGMKNIPDNFIDLIVTSPPYWLNKEYERKTTWLEYKTLINSFFIESHRVLKGGGYLVINFGDYFNSSNRFYIADVPSVQPASLYIFTWAMKLPFDLQATRIWRKQFAKMGIPFVCNTHPRNIFDYEHIWTFRKRNGSSVEHVYDRKLSQRGVLGDNWTSTAGLSKHCSAFPIELASWAIECYSKPLDFVLDPFLGSGTSALASKILNRKFVGFEIDPKYYNIAVNRIK
jgi:DNA modification methylase